MKSRIQLLVLGCLLTGCGRPFQYTNSQSGRYQIVVGEWELGSAGTRHAVTLKIDTWTGATWKYAASADNGIYPTWEPIPWPDAKQEAPK